MIKAHLQILFWWMVVKASLNVATDVFKSLGLTNIPVIGLAKEFEHVFIPQTPSPLILPRDSEACYCYRG